MHALAEQLNTDLRAGANAAYELLSEKGRRAFFPSKGILGQSAEAKKAGINATIGTAFEEDGSALTLECLEEMVKLPSSSFLYEPSFGNPELRQQWRKMLDEKNPSLRGMSISLPVVTSALTHALSVVGQLFADPGDEILLADLYWDNYDLIFCEAYGAKLKTYSTFRNGGYDTGALEAALRDGKPGKRLLLLNFPNNPAGYTVTEKEADELCRVLLAAAQAGNKLTVVLDDAYFGLVFEQGVCRESLFPRLACLHENILAVKLDGPTKEDYVWGFRVGFVTYGIKNATEAQYKALEAKTAGAVRGSISNASSIGQQLLLKAFQHPEYALQKRRKFELLQARYSRIREIFAAHPEYAAAFEVIPFNSGYFMCVRPLGVAPEAVRQELLASFSTGVIVLSGLIRLAFSAVPLAKLEPLFNNLYQAIRKLQGA